MRILRRMGAFGIVAGFVLAAPNVLVSGAAAAEVVDQTVPVAAHKTVITSDGSAGIRLNVPEPALLPDDNMSIELTGGTFAFVGIVTPTCEKLEGMREVCMQFENYLIPEAGELTPFRLAPDPATVPQGINEVYIVTDGQVTFTAIFENLSGATHLDAAGEIDATIEKIVTQCSGAEVCSNVGYGGTSHDLGDGGFNAAIAYSYRSNFIGETPVFNAGSNGVVACAYPGYQAQTASPNPADHPYGCDFAPAGNQDFAVVNGGLGFVQKSAQVGVIGWAHLANNHLGTKGMAYLGATVQQISPAQPGHFGAYGMWLSFGIGPP